MSRWKTRAQRDASGRTAIAAVGVAFLITELLIVSVRRAPSWDEAIYLSQVSRASPALPFAASRARGVVLLVAPLTELGGPVAAVRVFLAVASAAALAGAFAIWEPLVGSAAALGAFLFGFSWLGLFYGSAVMPNLWAAILCVGASGAFARSLAGDQKRWWWWAGLVAAVGLFRPTDALVLGLALALYVLVWRRDAVGLLVPLAGALVVGWGPWLIEMSDRFGGPIRAIRAAGAIGHVTGLGIGTRLLQHLALTDGPTLGPERHPHIPIIGLLWWGGLVALTVVALLNRSGRSEPLRMAAVVGALLAGEYLLAVSGLAPRFLLPAYGMLSVPAAVGLRSLRRGGAVARAAGLVAILLLVIWSMAQLDIAYRIGRSAASEAAAPSIVGRQVRAAARGRPCTVASTDAFPQVAFAAACFGRQLSSVDASSLAASLRATSGRGPAFILTRAALSPSSAPVATPIPSNQPGWFLYELPG